MSFDRNPGLEMIWMCMWCFMISLSLSLVVSQMATLEQVGEEVVGQARCPFESRQSNVGLFAGELAEPRPSGEKHDLTFNLANILLTFHKVQLLLL